VILLTLAAVKAQLNISHSSQDTKLTGIINRAEGAVLDYIGQSRSATLQELTAALGADKLSTATDVCMIATELWWGDAGRDIWKGGTLARLLFPCRVPAIGIGATS
jgi:hypothetical protein